MELLKCQLPPELWMVICEFMEPDELVKYMGIHSVFYDWTMDLRYREVELKDLQPSRLLKLIEKLKTPDAAGRVRVLTIFPVALQSAIHDDPNGPQAKPFHPLLRAIVQLLRFKQERQRKKARNRLIKERYHDVKDAGQELTGVESVNLLWHATSGVPIHFDETLFTAIKPIFGSNLERLYLEIPLVALVKTHSYLTALDDLEELELDLSEDPMGSASKLDPNIAITSALLPFINRLSRSLRVLSLTIKNHAQLSPLFHGLGYFPRLERLMLNIPFDLHHINNPSDFNRLLVNHPNLRELYITHLSCCMSHQSPREDIGKRWVWSCFQGIAFTDLKTLSLGLTHAFHLRFMNAMTPLAQSLSSLILTEPVLHYADVENVLTFLTAPQLSSLTLFVDTLTPQLLALLAEQRPDLEYLDLKITQCSRAEGIQGPHDEPGFIYGLETYHKSHHQIYSAWKLRRLSIAMWIYTLGPREQPELMKAIAAKLPKLRYPV
ncbi:hypothetical protein BDZ94DRAFT_1318581 [Collybia nuda]|uniref:F-box domain-containing protein n=1 Tax=Collybia nuda TaxID=64659 RepID=A0A9P5YCS6_9AGAR|nr:hypothetical protein BDZ94DRAFT_1318581 [Collybia nuda]